MEEMILGDYKSQHDYIANQFLTERLNDMELQTQTVSPVLFVQGDYSKTSIAKLSTLLVDQVLEMGNPLELAEQIAASENLIKAIKEDKRFSDYVHEQLDQYKGKFNTESGTKIESAEVGTKYDFSVCKDFVLEEMSNELLLLEEQIKKRREFLKTTPSTGLIITDEKTGETMTVYPPVKTSTSSYKVTLAK